MIAYLAVDGWVAVAAAAVGATAAEPNRRTAKHL